MTERQLNSPHEDLSEAIAQVEDGNPVVLRFTGAPVAALVSLRDLGLLEQYWEELENRADLDAVRQAREEIVREGTVPYEVFRQELGL